MVRSMAQSISRAASGSMRSVARTRLISALFRNGKTMRKEPAGEVPRRQSGLRPRWRFRNIHTRRVTGFGFKETTPG